MATDQRTFELNADKLRKHFQTYCKDMGMSVGDWTGNIYRTPQSMMEGTSPKRLNADFTHRHSGKVLSFQIGFYPRYGYKIRETT